DQMIKCVQEYDGSHFTNQGKFIQNSWERFLNDRRTTNSTLLESDANIKADLNSERIQVEAYIAQTDPDPNYSETWRKFLVCEKEILDHLIERCD
ncbi:MAG: hypothetical protein OEQ39_28725, partial [Gammaproteobacteria bacterium]|nr:hypothetical protein [Gammaproteobacteria bacterium]